jgi:putative ABC transport system permease protein
MRQNFPPLNTGEIDDAVSFIIYQPRTRPIHETAKLEVHKVVAGNHGFPYDTADAYDEWDSIRTADQVGKIFDAMNMFLGSVGLVTLSLGAIGIVNIMLVAVADRTREIGLRKALGATNRSIMFQFFTEGAFLTVLSGGLGIGGAAGFMAALAQLPPLPGWDPPKLVVSSALLALCSLSVAGVAAGLYPASQAAALQPVEALRKE